jgi:hypothetical protein
MLDWQDHDDALETECAAKSEIEFETEADHEEDKAEKVFSLCEYQAGFWS